MKKAISIFVATAWIVSMMSMTVFAYGGHREHNTRVWQQPKPRHTFCTVDGCDVLEPHQHDDIWYCSQAGYCSDYKVCAVSGCAEIGIHEHNGDYYHCTSSGTGHHGH